jgi:hypothetical protein
VKQEMDRKQETVGVVKENHTENNCITTQKQKIFGAEKKNIIAH